MPSKLSRLGDYIDICDVRNRDNRITAVKGISTTKQFIETNANMTGVDISTYKVVDTGNFAYVADTSRRGEKIALAFNDAEPCIVSSIYTAFKVKDLNLLLPEYLFLWFRRQEFDRYARYHSWGSARETFDWMDMCDVMLPIPPIDEQRKYVNLYNALVKNQRAYEATIGDLQLISNTFLEVQSKKGMRRLGQYIQKVDTRNTRLSVENLRGISTSKQFIKSNANTSGVDFYGYRVVQPNQFAYVPDTSRRGDKIALAMNQTSDSFIVSAIYSVFEVKKDCELLPEYLYLWFSRPEFDRYARYHSWGSARETFDWADMCDVMLPIPSPEEQKSIVAIHHTLETRKQLNDHLKEAIRPLCPVLIQGVIKDLKAAA